MCRILLVNSVEYIVEMLSIIQQFCNILGNIQLTIGICKYKYFSESLICGQETIVFNMKFSKIVRLANSQEPIYTFLNNILAITSWIFGIHKNIYFFWNINLLAGNCCFRHQMLQNYAFWSIDTTAKHQFAQKWFIDFSQLRAFCVSKK